MTEIDKTLADLQTSLRFCELVEKDWIRNFVTTVNRICEKNRLDCHWVYPSQAHEEKTHHDRSFLAVVKVGDVKAKTNLMLTSGLHGVEGRFGVVLQTHFLNSLSPKLLGNTCVTFVFALNKHGFFQCSRWGQGNSDLNRVFYMTDKDSPKVADAAKLANLGSSDNQESATKACETSTVHQIWENLYNSFGPKASSPSWVNFLGLSLRLILRYGWKNLVRALPQGQKLFPNFIFYNGDSDQKSVSEIKTLMQQLIESHNKTLNVDIHTGLGKKSKMYILDPSPSLSMGAKPTKNAYPTPGSLTSWCGEFFLSTRYESCTMEFGTVPGLYVFYRLLQSNHREQAFQSSQKANSNFLELKAQSLVDKQKLLEAFFPKSNRWCQSCLNSGMDYLHQVLKALS